MNTFTLTLLFMAFVLLGGLLANLMWIHNKIGILRIDDSDPDGPYMFLQIDRGDVPALRKSKYVVLEVKNQNFIPRN